MGIRKINESTLTAIGNAIRGKTGGSALINPEDMADEIENIPSGATITDGIIINSRDSNNRPSDIDYYGEFVSAQGLGSPNGTVGFGAGLTKVVFHGTKSLANEALALTRQLTTITGLFENLSYIGSSAFSQCGYEGEVTIKSDATYGNYPFQNSKFSKLTILSSTNPTEAFCYNNKVITDFEAKFIKSAPYRLLGGCTALERVELGSVGNSITSVHNGSFQGVTQTGLTIIIYTTGSYADTALANARNGATNATIIIKASENTTYNNVSYSAGDTIVASTV